MSTYTQASTSTDRERPGSGHTAQKELWSSMLDGVASGKRLPEKNLLVLGEFAYKDVITMLIRIRWYWRNAEGISGGSVNTSYETSSRS